MSAGQGSVTVPKAQRDAADLIERNGLAKGQLFEELPGVPVRDCPMCVIGALNTAVHGQPHQAGNSVVLTAIRSLESYLGRLITRWNDAPERTAPEVASALRACADQLEGTADGCVR